MARKDPPDTLHASHLRDSVWGYLFLAPMLILTLTFVIYPIFGSVRIAFYNWDGIGNPTQYVGLRHFMGVAKDPWFWGALKHTVIYAAVLVPVQLFLALILALLLNNSRLKGVNFFRALYFMPVVTSGAVVGVVINLLFGNFASGLSAPLIKLGLISTPLDLLGSPSLALGCIIAVGIWHTLGYNLIYFLASLQAVPEELYEAAEVDGASKVQRLVHVTLPSIRPMMVIIVFMAILGSLGQFDLVKTMTDGGPYYASDLVSTYIYSYAFASSHGMSQSNYGLASAASLFMSLMVFGFTMLQLLAIKVSRKERGVS